MTEQQRETRERVEYSLEQLRTEDLGEWVLGVSCPLCTCPKSGWVDMANFTAEWCEDLLCCCHEEGR